MLIQMIESFEDILNNSSRLGMCGFCTTLNRKKGTFIISLSCLPSRYSKMT